MDFKTIINRNCFWVDEKHADASDRNNGTRDKPFASYQQALEVARRGIDLIIINPIRNYSSKYMKELPEGMTDQGYEEHVSNQPIRQSCEKHRCMFTCSACEQEKGIH